MNAATPDSTNRGVVALVSLQIALAALYFCWPVWRAQWPLEIDGNEAWNAFLVQRLQASLPLYPAQGDLISNNYPPLSFLTLQALAKLGLQPIPAGRMLSLLAVLISAGGIARIASLFGAGLLAIAVGSAWYIGTMARFFDTYVGMNDPNLPALAIMIWGMAWIIWAQKNNKAVEPGFVLLVLAGFYKNALFAIPAASLIWLATQNRRRALRAGIFSAACIVLGLTICVVVFGENFIAQLTAPRTFRAGHFIASLGRIQFVLPALLVVLWWIFRRRRFPPAQFAALFIVLASASHGVQQFGDGIDDNSQFELVVALAIALGLAFQYGPGSGALGRAQIAIISMLLIRLLLSNRTEPYLLLSSKAYRDIGSASVQIAKSEIDRVTAIPGDVSCTIMTICYEAHKPFVYYPFNVQQKLDMKILSREQLAATVAKQNIVFASIDPRADMHAFRYAASKLLVRRLIIY